MLASLIEHQADANSRTSVANLFVTLLIPEPWLKEVRASGNLEAVHGHLRMRYSIFAFYN